MSGVFDSRPCTLGEGPLWHPERETLFWFDIIGKRLLSKGADGTAEWSFDEHVSAAGWIDRESLLIASERALFRFDLGSGERTDLVALEPDDPVTRSNDGRADPWGGFWIGTMGKAAQPERGAIYRYHGGELRRLVARVTISNAIAFAPDRRFATFTDTPTRKVMRLALGPDGWPRGQPEVWLDLAAEGLNPDGAVFDSRGRFWLAEWGAARVSCYGPDGSRLRSVDFPAPHTSCPAFAGPDLTTLCCTTALQGMDEAQRAAFPLAGQTFAAPVDAAGLPEPRVVLASGTQAHRPAS